MRRRFLVSALLLALPSLLSCRGKSESLYSSGDPAPGEITHPARGEFVFAVYLPQEVADFPARVEAIRRDSYPEVHAWTPDQQESSLPSIEVNLPSIEEFEPIAAEDIPIFGRNLDARDARTLPGVKHVGVMIFHSTPRELSRIYPTALRLAHDVAAEVGGILWDEETREAFSVEKWRTSRIDSMAEPLDIRDHITIHMYRDGELNRLVTLGMAKLDLPDLVVDQVAPHATSRMGNVINLVAQTLLESGENEKLSKVQLDVATVQNAAARAALSSGWLEGATGKADVALRPVPRQEGDAANTLLALTFPGTPDQQGIRHNELIDHLWGSHDELVEARHTDDILAESKRARAALMALKPHFQAGLAPNERLMVKGPFATPDGGHEWMWVDVVRWNGKTILGILQNDPFQIPGLEAGAEVSVSEEDVFDYLHYRPDGSEVGNTTAELLK